MCEHACVCRRFNESVASFLSLHFTSREPDLLVPAFFFFMLILISNSDFCWQVGATFVFSLGGFTVGVQKDVCWTLLSYDTSDAG